jgi:hypothetical protein
LRAPEALKRQTTRNDGLPHLFILIGIGVFRVRVEPALRETRESCLNMRAIASAPGRIVKPL